MLVTVKRQKDPQSEPYLQSFFVEASPQMTVSALLDKLNYTDDLYDVKGQAFRPFLHVFLQRRALPPFCSWGNICVPPPGYEAAPLHLAILVLS